MNEQQARQLASNEALFRTVNEKIVGLNETFESLAQGCAFLCECSHIGCIEQVELTLAEYEHVRGNPRRFIVAPSQEHLVAEIDLVIEQTSRYFIVEKHGAAADEVERLAAE
jgi:hypothetical protein